MHVEGGHYEKNYSDYSFCPYLSFSGCLQRRPDDRGNLRGRTRGSGNPGGERSRFFTGRRVHSKRSAGGDLFRIETTQEYPGTHDALLEFAYQELTDNARPELASQIENLEGYDVIFLGYPNGNSDLPMPLYTFLEAYDFSGKTIIPFVTHGGSSFSRTIQTIENLQPGAAVVEDSLSISRGSVPDAENDVVQWVAGLNL